MNSLIKRFDSNETAFSYFRFCFYLITLWIFSRNMGFFSDWSLIDPVFWEPVSFFKFFSYDDFSFISMHTVRFIFLGSMLACAFGFGFRFFSVLAFLSFTFAAGFQCNFGKIHHSNHMTAVLLGLLCFVPAGALSLDRLIFKKRAPASNLPIWSWIFFTLTMYMCLVYFNAGFSKLREAGWAWTENEAMATIILTRPTVTPLGIWVAQSDWIPGLLAKFSLLLEFLAPTALLLKARSRALYGFMLFMLHQGTYWILGAHGAFFAYQVCFLAWLPWTEISRFLRFKRSEPV